jgi:hypothetical protein
MKIRLLLAILAYLPGVLLTTAFHELKAQQKRYALPQIIPKSPDVASMEVYGTIPVSESTGTSNLSIPLVNLTIGSFTLPISLNYYKSGLKVEEVPSSVGDGWSLQYGGMISFQQRGINDFKQYGMLYGGPGSGALTQVKKLLRGHMTSYERWNYLESLIRGDLDSEFDQYNYNFLGKSGSYYYDSLMQVVLLPKSDLKVIRQENEIRIIDNDNNIYYFGAIENASSYDASDVEVRPSFNDISAYYLSKIVTKENRVILFKYKNYSFSVNQVKTGITHMQASSNPDCNISGVNAYNEIINIGCLLPDSIIFDQGFVKFVQGTSIKSTL